MDVLGALDVWMANTKSLDPWVSGLRDSGTVWKYRFEYDTSVLGRSRAGMTSTPCQTLCYIYHTYTGLTSCCEG